MSPSRVNCGMLHELWLDETNNSQTFCLAGSEGDSTRAWLSKKAKLVWTVEAESHFEAMTKYYEYMGWVSTLLTSQSWIRRPNKELGWE